jgi:beta-galactosidase/beta-glucuronidase
LQPRPEYPRPQFVREDWLNLNGIWEFAFDDANRGLQERWYEGRSLDLRILVPFPYQCELSGINDKSIHEVVWYACNFDVPERWGKQDVLLHFGAVDYRTTVWVNGNEVGHNRGGHVPFSFDIRPYIEAGRNRLTLRVEDRQDPYQPRGKQSPSGKPHGIDYYCSTGIWQTVWLEPVPPIRIAEIRITPNLEESLLELNVQLHAPATGWRIEIVSSADGSSALASLRLRLALSEPRLWSPETPHLYGVHIRLYDGADLLDAITSYAGMRGVSIDRGRICLNGKPSYLTMLLDQGYWPESYLAAPSDEALRKDVELIKDLGFTGARKHQKVEDPRWLYWCDRLGLLVWGEMANARAWSTESEEALLAEWERVVRRDFNHPCIITWVPVNESMGFPGLEESHPGQYAFIERVVEVTRRLDPTRLVVDNDGWEHTDIGDICAIHDYTSTGGELQKRYHNTLTGGPLPSTVWYRDKPLYVLGSEHRGQPVMLTEVGGFLSVPADVAPEDRDRLYEFYAMVKSEEEILEKYADLAEGLYSLKFLAGFCYTQLTDIEQELNGLLRYDRTPKVPLHAIRAINRRFV